MLNSMRIQLRSPTLSRLACFSLLALSLGVNAQIYKWTDKDGKIHYGDKPPNEVETEDMSDIEQRINIDSSSGDKKETQDVFPLNLPRQNQINEKEKIDKNRKEQEKLIKMLKCNEARVRLNTIRSKIDREERSEHSSWNTIKEQRKLMEKQQKIVDRRCS